MACAAIGLPGCANGRGVPPAAPVAIGVGHGARFRPPSLGGAAAQARPIGSLRCSPAPARRFGAHLELFAAARVVLVPPGVGIAPPRRSSGAYVSGGHCAYATITREPTGVIEVSGARTLGDFFAIWGQPLSPRRFAGFSGVVRVYVGGRAVHRDPRTVELARNAEIVLEVGPAVAPHSFYRFAPGL